VNARSTATNLDPAFIERINALTEQMLHPTEPNEQGSSMTRPRDSQASKVWKASDAVAPPTPTTALDQRTLSKAADRLIKSIWFSRRARKTGEAYSILFTPGTMCRDQNYCQLAPNRRDYLNMLHQIAHYMLQDNVAWHGPEFAKLLLELVGHVGLSPASNTAELRKADAAKLKDSFNKHGVKWRVYSDEARANARTRWFERDLKNLASELQEDVS
jgi:hypothetical protein